MKKSSAPRSTKQLRAKAFNPANWGIVVGFALILVLSLKANFGVASLYRNPVSVQAEADTTPPTAPLNLTVKSYLATARSGGSQDVLSWTASSDNVGVAGYIVYQVVGGTVSGGNPLAEVTATTWTRSFPVDGYATDYTYYVVAKDTSANLSAKSNLAHMQGIWGDILDKANSRYIRGASVKATGNGTTFSQTATYSGAYLMNLPAGTYTVVYSASGYVPQTKVLTVDTNAMATWNVFLQKSPTKK